jgi:acetyl-CoA carboxylase alpha subunit
LIDGIVIPEPLGGAHRDPPEQAPALLRQEIEQVLQALQQVRPGYALVELRWKRLRSIGSAR